MVPVDTIRMIPTDALNQELDAHCVEVLQTYAVRETTVKAVESDEHTGWLDRVNQVPGLDAAELTTAHGVLIAEGLLKFEVTGRCHGLQYQLSPLGREIVSSSKRVTVDDSAGRNVESDDSEAN